MDEFEADAVNNPQAKHEYVITPHKDTRYAVVFWREEDDSEHRVVAAVHAFADDGCALVSRRNVHGFERPMWVAYERVLVISPTEERAEDAMWRLEDRK